MVDFKKLRERNRTESKQAKERRGLEREFSNMIYVTKQILKKDFTSISRCSLIDLHNMKNSLESFGSLLLDIKETRDKHKNEFHTNNEEASPEDFKKDTGWLR